MLENLLHSDHSALWKSLTAIIPDYAKSLDTRLREHRGNHLDIRVELTAAGHTARLVAIRASAGETEKRSRETRADAKAKGRTANRRTLLLAGWHILVTNIPKEMQSAESLAGIRELPELSSLHPDPRHVQTQKRRRKSLALKYFACLG